MNELLPAVAIIRYSRQYLDRLIEMVLHIQQDEFGVPVTIADQPDLLTIEDVYQSKKGNFWIALNGEQVIGTIGLIDIGNRQSALRKMFVHRDYRGKEKAVGQHLLDTLINWCQQHSIDEVYLGTVERMLAAHRFYRKNGFYQLGKSELPENFPLMPVDNTFFARKGILT